MDTPSAAACRRGGWSRLGPDSLRLWRDQLGACLGFDPQASAPMKPPAILLVDRRYQEARHLENVEELLAGLQAAYGGFAGVTLHYMHVSGCRMLAGR